ncbi:MAG: hypothetical protein EP343_14410 [Deltaproteobacteria bacterium]|nr:MAG: hypothetical protein EP343_14410 [Deltaproteobacteria bacterium]
MRKNRFGSWRRLQLAVMALLFVGLGCNSSGSSGCSCAKPIQGGFPKADIVSNVTQVKLTKRGTDFLQTNNAALIKMFLPTGLTFDVPQTKSSNVEVCRNPPCKIIGNIRKLDIAMVPKNKIRAGLWLDIKTQRDMEIRVSQKVLFATIRKTCKVSLRVSNKKITTDITFGLHPTNKHMTVSIGDPSFSLSNSDFKINGDVICKLVDLLKGLFKGLIEKEAKKALGDAIGDFTCKSCKTTADCGSGATCSKGVCMAGGSCLPLPLGFEGAVDTAGLLQGFGNKLSTDLMFSAFVGGRVEVKADGLELGMLGGTSAKTNPCVAPKTFPKLPTPVALTFPANSPNNKPFMVGIGVSDVMLKAAARDLYRSGALCLKIDSSLSEQLGSVFSAQGIGTLFTSLGQIVGQSNPPLYIALRPTEPPVLDIGKGTVGKDAKGNTTITDPLIDFSIPKLNFDFMMKFHGRWVRLFTFQSDVNLPLALTVKPGNKLGLVLGELSAALKNPKVLHSYMLSEKPEIIASTLANTLKAVIPLAAGSLGNQEFDLPDLQGFKLTISDMTGLIPRKDKPNRFQFLGLFADLGLAPPSKPLMPEAPIGVRLIRTNFPEGFFTKIKTAMVKKFPSIVVELSDPRPNREYSFRLNGGIWGPYRAGQYHTLETAQLIFEGNHKLEVRSRSAIAHHEEDFGQGRLTFKVDRTAPTIKLSKKGEILAPVAKDNLSKADDVRLEYRLGNQMWQDLNGNETVDLSKLANGTVVSIRATDASGNKTVKTTTVFRASASTTPAPKAAAAPAPKQVEQPATPSSPSGRACSQLGAPSPVPAPWWLLLVFVGLIVWRRR